MSQSALCQIPTGPHRARAQRIGTSGEARMRWIAVASCNACGAESKVDTSERPTPVTDATTAVPHDALTRERAMR